MYVRIQKNCATIELATEDELTTANAVVLTIDGFVHRISSGDIRDLQEVITKFRKVVDE